MPVPSPAAQTRTDPVAQGKTDRGGRNHCFGRAAEDAVARLYIAKGAKLLHRRWRGAAGEIDLIFRLGDAYVFVEVKASRSFDQAVSHISPRQVARIHRAAEVFLATTPEGAFANARFDAALVDVTGAVELMEGALVP